MKYIKMIVLSLLIAFVVLAYFWVVASFGNVGMVISSALVAPIVLLLAYYLVSGLKGNDLLVAGITMAVVGVGGLFVFVLLANWPWAFIGQATAPYNHGIITPYVRIIIVLFDWPVFIGLIIGAGIAIPIVMVLMKKKS